MPSDATGRLVAIARKAKPHAVVEEIAGCAVTPQAGIEGDWRGRSGDRQVTVLAAEAWAAACAALGAEIPWTTRRANLLVAGVDLPRTVGARILIGDVVLKVTGETDPCGRMDAQVPGLRAALRPDWRGGVTCVVAHGGRIQPGDSVRLADPSP
ncbi:MOSC domain-containing protein [Zavarzinia sp. CC-PAN008]|uniref:MOSC domain-containing protein n=1 Tax=Zavarzinia sp. CC-PAN008 TaxID=3243332 RepID=UPI003F7479DB